MDLILPDPGLPQPGLEEVEEKNIAQYDATIPETDSGKEDLLNWSWKGRGGEGRG